MNYQELINTNIKNLRKSNNLTQEEFAEKIDISIQGLSNIERNRYQPTAETIDKICKAFKITPYELLLPEISDKENIINSYALILPEKQIKKIYKIINLLIKL